MPRYREEVINSELAELLRKCGLQADPETIKKANKPDVIINMGGLNVVIEGRFGNKQSLRRDVKARIEEGIADISLGILYPSELREADDLNHLREKIKRCLYHGFVCYYGKQGVESQDFESSGLRDVVEILNNIFGIYIRNDLVREQVKDVEELLEEAVDDICKTNFFFNSEALVERLRDTLGVTNHEQKEKPSKKKSQREIKDLLRIATFVLLNALIFHEVLASAGKGGSSLRRAQSHRQKFLLAEWQKILKDDYAPVFWLAREILNAFPTSPQTESLLKQLADKALEVVASGILLKHDFMGRIYHKLLLRTTGKYYATFYTSIPAAWLLANLIFKTPHPSWDFADVGNIENFRVIDPACGSGTLLSAAYMAMKQMYVISAPQTVDLRTFHRLCMENIFHGWDILDYATHLTLTTLALHNYRSSFSSCNIYTLPAGVERVNGQEVVHLGSLDYLSKQLAFKGWGFTAPVISKGMAGDKREQQIPVPKADVVIMNPPFSRSANPNVKFGYSQEKVKKKMNEELSKLTRQLGMEGIGQAGLGPYFILLADRLLKSNGRMGIVIPRGMLSGVSWSKIREKLMKGYEVEYIVSNHDPGDNAQGIEPWNWSENTDLAEVLIVARKTKETRDTKVLYINLWNKPKNELESLWLSQQVLRLQKSLSRTLAYGDWKSLRLSGKEIGAIYYVPQQDLRDNWLVPCLFANPELNKFLMEIKDRLRSKLIPLSKISEHLGIDCSTVSRSLQETSSVTPLQVVWGHKLDMNTINAQRYIGYAHGPSRLQAYSGNLLLPYTLYLQNHKVAAFFSPQKVLSNMFWTVKMAEENDAKLIALWLNSTFGFLFLLSVGIASKGFHFEFKQGNLKQLLVVNPKLIEKSRVSRLYQSLHNRPFERFADEFSQAFQGKGVRREIDNFFLQELGCPVNLTPYYEMLSKEPILTLSRL